MPHSQNGACVPQSQDGARAPPCTSLLAPLSMHWQVNCSHVYTESSKRMAQFVTSVTLEGKQI